MLKTLRSYLNFSKKTYQTQLYLQNRLSEKLEEIQWEKKKDFGLRKYEDLFGITRLKELHERVLQAQKSLLTVQEKRRKIQEDLFVTQKKLQESQDVLHKTPMGDNNYIAIVTQVQELLKEQKNLQETFAWYDQTEKEQQTTLALAINNSQDHERTNLEKNKYLSLLTGVIGGVLGLIGSSIKNWKNRKEVKLYESHLSDQVITVQKAVEQLKSKVSSNEGDPKQSENVWLQIKEQQELFNDNVNSLQSLVDNITAGKKQGDDFYTDLQFKRMALELEKDLNSKLNYHTSLNIGVISSILLLGTFLLYMTNTG